MKKLISLTTVIALILVLLPFSVAKVPVGSTGIMLTLGRVEDTALSEGWHFKMPFVQRIVSMDNRVMKLEMSTEAFSKDIQTVYATLAVNYRMQRDKTFEIYKSVGTNYENNLVIPAVHEILKSVCAQYTAEELISKRAESSELMREELDMKLNPIGITVTDFNIIDFDFSQEFIAAVEAKQVAEQLKKKAAIENDTAIAKAEREKTVAIKQSEAEAERVRIASEADANAVKVAAEAEAYRLQQENAYITDMTIKKEMIAQWDGVLPITVGEGVTPLLNVADLMGDDAE